MDLAKDKGILVAHLSADDLKDPVGVYRVIEELILDEQERRILVDLSGIELMTSLQIGILVSLHVLAYENVVVLKFAGLNEKLAEVFRLVGVDTLIEMHYGRQEALRAFETDREES